MVAIYYYFMSALWESNYPCLIMVAVLANYLFNIILGLPVHPATVEPDVEEVLKEQRIIYRIEPDERGGEEFELI